MIHTLEPFATCSEVAYLPAVIIQLKVKCESFSAEAVANITIIGMLPQASKSNYFVGQLGSVIEFDNDSMSDTHILGLVRTLQFSIQ